MCFESQVLHEIWLFSACSRVYCGVLVSGIVKNSIHLEYVTSKLIAKRCISEKMSLFCFSKVQSKIFHYVLDKPTQV